VLESDGRVVADLTPGLDDWVLTFESGTAAASGAGQSMRPAFKDVAVPPVPSATLARAVRPRVAIGIPMTSRKLRLTAVESSPLMKIAVPSIVKSLPGDRAKFHVVIYAGYDEGDAFWSKVSGGGGGECGGGGDGNGVCVCVCVCVCACALAPTRDKEMCAW
jgi:hypothetical protein